MASRLEEIRNERIEKLKKLVALGISPFPAQSHKEFSNGTVVNDFEQFDGKVISLTGRLRALREHGKLAFGDLEDQSGKIQLLLRASNLVAMDKKKGTIGFAELSLIDVGDFVEAKGLVCKSKTGAISIDVQEFRLLTKSIRPLPDSWEGLKDPDTIFRRRYLDLIMNPGHRELFIRKSKFWSIARLFMAEAGFLEVETPVLEHVTGGADAKPFETHHNALDETFYMRISTELYQKRLLGGGFEKIYTLAPNFRNEGIDDEHLQEYYQLEWYWAYADFRDNMTLTRDLFRALANGVYGTTKFTRGEHTFDLAGDWEEIDYATVILNKLGIDIFTDSTAKMAEVLMKNGVKLDGKVGKARLVDNLWKIIRKGVAGPAFLINVPKFISPLAKSYADNEAITERFQIILAGSELCNGYSELNDPLDQLARFSDQQSQRDAGDDEAQMLDIDYVEMLEYGMPPASGLGVSERLFWFLENVTAREGTLFPQMKRHVSQLTKNIYGISDPIAAKQTKKMSQVAPKPKGTVTRDEALKIVRENVKNENLVRHMLAVEAAMAAYAKKFGEDEETYRVTGLLHDFDWEIHPTLEKHPQAGSEILRQKGVSEEIIRAILSHALHTGVSRDTNLEKALFASDELTGLITTTALVRPSKKISEVETKSIKKKWKDKSFAAGVNRDEVEMGAKDLGVDLWEDHVPTVLKAMQEVAEDLGL